MRDIYLESRESCRSPGVTQTQHMDIEQLSHRELLRMLSERRSDSVQSGALRTWHGGPVAWEAAVREAGY